MQSQIKMQVYINVYKILTLFQSTQGRWRGLSLAPGFSATVMRLKLMRKNSEPLLCRPHDGGQQATPGGPADDGDRGENEKRERRKRGAFRVPRYNTQ
jgi:hypothetical protein